MSNGLIVFCSSAPLGTLKTTKPTRGLALEPGLWGGGVHRPSATDNFTMVSPALSPAGFEEIPDSLSPLDWAK